MGVGAAQDGPSPYSPSIITTGNETPNTTAIGAGNALYGMKIALEDLDESFTFNQTQKLAKQMKHANLRITEAQQELAMNRTHYADRALDLYMQKINLTGTTLAEVPANTTGLLHAQDMIAHHNQVLAGLVLSHPDNTGLARAYNNSLILSYKFEEKNSIRLGRTTGQGNTTPPGQNQVSLQDANRHGNGNGNTVQTGEMTGNNQQGKPQGNTNASSGSTTIIPQPVQTEPAPSVTIAPQDTRGAMGNQGNKNGNGNTDAGGQGKSK
jgi:hypothetical protein